MRARPCRPKRGASRCRRSTGGAGRTSRPTGAATGRSGSSWCCSWSSLFAEFIANDKPFSCSVDGKTYFPVFVTYPETAFGGDFETAADYRDPYLQKLIAEKGGIMIWPPIRYLLRHPQSRPADAGAVASRPGC